MSPASISTPFVPLVIIVPSGASNVIVVALVITGVPGVVNA